VEPPILPDKVTLIIADAPPLKGIRQRVQQLAARFATILSPIGGRLLYIDEPGNIVTVFISPEKPLSNLWSWTAGPVFDPETGIHHFVPPSGLPFGYHSGPVNRWNHFWNRVSLGTRFVKGDGPVVLIVCNVLGLGWLGRFGEDIAIYDCADEISEFRQASLNREAVLAQERELLGRVDAVVATAGSLFEAKSKHSKRPELIRNAAEIEHFRKALAKNPRPKDIEQLQKPIIGYYGYLADWLDWPLIEHVIREGKEFDWVFIGPCTRNLSDLTALGNFHALGKKPYAQLPAYLSHFACAHIPFDRTPLTVHVNPVKVYEYLAGGAPVVATSLPELEAFSDVCRITNDPGEYLEAIRREVAGDTPDKRLNRSERVKDETWDSRVTDYCSLIGDLLRS
jgi:hypothetical protein